MAIPWPRGLMPGKVMDISSMKELVNPDHLVARMSLAGEHPYVDIVMITRGAYPRAEARTLRAFGLVGPSLSLMNFLCLKKAEGAYGP